MPCPDGRRIKISASRGQCLHDRCCIWPVPGPIGEEMQRRPPAASVIFDHASDKSGIGRQQLTQPLNLALLEGRRQIGRKWFVAT
jgi:hypothetical protein